MRERAALLHGPVCGIEACSIVSDAHVRCEARRDPTAFDALLMPSVHIAPMHYRIVSY